jgi:hypothetical protein
MAGINYFDFDLLIERAAASATPGVAPGSSYRVRVLASPAGQSSAEFVLPFSPLEIENLLLRVGRPAAATRHVDSPDMAVVRDFGGRLFAALFTGEVLAGWRSSVGQAEAVGAGLRCRLRLNDVAELADLPWEYLYDAVSGRFIVLSTETPIIRYLDLPDPLRPLMVKPPVRILVMIASPADAPALDVEGEWLRLTDALAELQRQNVVALERLDEATLPALQRLLRRSQYQVFHFIGHGAFDEAGQDGVLLLEDEAGRGQPVSSAYLGTLLHDHHTLRLAVLNACEGGRTAQNDPFAGVAQGLVRQGLPAVIAMQFAISDAAAATFSHEFYAALADGYPADAALQEARKAIYAQGDNLEWGTPVLYSRTPDACLFDIQGAGAAGRRPASPGAAQRATPKFPAQRPTWFWGVVAAALIVLIGLAALAGRSGWIFGPTPTTTPAPGAEATATAWAAQCQIMAGQLVLYAGPGFAYERLKAYPVGTTMRPVARIPNGQWLLVRVIGSEEMGWSRGADTFVVCNSDLAALLDGLPVLDVPTAPPGSAPDTATPTPLITPTVTETPVPSATPTVTSTPCALVSDPAFRSTSSGLGCPLHPAQPVTMAWQRFADGLMLWRAGTVYVMIGTESGYWRSYADPWQTGMPQVSCDEANHQSYPVVRGFGYRWCQTPSIRGELGDPTGIETGGQWLMQEYTGGWAVQIPGWDNGTVVTFSGDGAWSHAAGAKGQ